jgi:hypothetical protein
MADFASKDDVQTRLGRTLTTEEQAQAEAVLGGVAGLIRAEVGKDTDWDPAPIPSAFAELSIQRAIAAITNPANVAAESKQLGAFQHSRTFQRSQDGGLALTEAEGRAMRFALYGTNAASARQRSHVDTTLDLLDDGEINDSIGS